MSGNGRLMLGVALVLAVICGGIAWWVARQWAGPSEQSLARWRAELEDPRPQVRLDAAAGLLRADPGQPHAGLVLAQAMIEMNRYQEARQVLAPLAEAEGAGARVTQAQRAQALGLLADSYLAQAGDAVEAAPARELQSPSFQEQVGDWLAEAQALGRQVAVASAPIQEVLIQARAQQVWSQLRQRDLLGRQSDLALAQAADLPEQVQILTMKITELRDRLAQGEKAMTALCGQAARLDPQAWEPPALLFQMWLGHGKVEPARALAQELADRPRLPRWLAGLAAHGLLSLEDSHALPVTDADAALAQRLLEHGDLTGPHDVRFLQAGIRLALFQGRWDLAQEQARAALRQFPGHPLLVCLLAEGMIGQGRPAQAIALLDEVNRRIAVAAVRTAMGRAYLADGQTSSGRDCLRQALELDPDALAPRLELARSMVEAGSMSEAEEDIQKAMRRSPRHPQALALLAQLAVDKGSYSALHDVLGRLPPPADWMPGDQLLLAELVAGDLVRVGRSLDAPAGQPPNQVLAALARSWLRAPLRRQATVAWLLGLAVVDHLEADPLRQAAGPVILALRQGRMAVPRMRPPTATQPAWGLDPGQLLAQELVAWPQDLALVLVEQSLRRRPEDPGFHELAGVLHLLLGRRHAAATYLEHSSLRGGGLLEAARALARGDAARAAAGLEQVPAQQRDGALLNAWLEIVAARGRGDGAAAVSALAQAAARHPAGEFLALAGLRGWTDDLVLLDDPAAWARAAGGDQARTFLVQARLLLASGRIDDLLAILDRLDGLDLDDPWVRMASADLRARGHLASGRVDAAEASLTGLERRMGPLAWVMRLARADLLIRADRPGSAAAGLAPALMAPSLGPREMDQMLARSRACLPADAFRQLLEQVHQTHPEDPLVWLYMGQSWMDSRQPDLALKAALRGLQRRPDAPRLMLLAGRAAAEAGDTAQARRWLHQAQACGDEAAALARAEMRRLELSATDSPSASQPGGLP